MLLFLPHRTGPPSFCCQPHAAATTETRPYSQSPKSPVSHVVGHAGTPISLSSGSPFTESKVPCQPCCGACRHSNLTLLRVTFSGSTALHSRYSSPVIFVAANRILGQRVKPYYLKTRISVVNHTLKQLQRYYYPQEYFFVVNSILGDEFNPNYHQFNLD